MSAKIYKLRASKSQVPCPPGDSATAVQRGRREPAPLTPSERSIADDLVRKYGFAREDARGWVQGLERRGRLEAVVYLEQATHIGPIHVIWLLTKHGVLP